MAKLKPDEVDEQVKQQEDEVYGTSYTEGDHEKFGDTEDMLEDVIGNSPVGDDEEEDDEKDDEEGFSIADAVAEDANAEVHAKPEDSEEVELEEELKKNRSSDE